jgi:hypothetical protein
MPTQFEIFFERSGGFLGRTVSVEIKSESLPLQEKEQIDTWIKNSGIMNLQTSENTVKQSPDRFQYIITIRRGNLTNSVTLNETAVIDELKPLVRYLVEKSRKDRIY